MPEIIGPGNFTEGERVRIYLSHLTCHDVEVREGVVTNPNNAKKRHWGKESALQLLVQNAGIVRFGEVSYEHRECLNFPYKNSFFYDCITKFEKLPKN